MGPLQNNVTYYEKLFAGWQIKQWVRSGAFKRNDFSLLNDVSSLCSCSPSSSFAIHQGVFCTITPGLNSPKSVIKVSKVWLIYNKFVGSNFFLTKLGLKVQNIEPIKLGKCGFTIADFIYTKMLNFRTFPFFISISKELFKGS